MMKKLINSVLMVMAVLAGGAQAAELVKGAHVASVANTKNNNDVFVLILRGGTGVCADKTVTFKAKNTDDYKKGKHYSPMMERAYASAQLALVHGLIVDIESEKTTDCGDALKLTLRRPAPSIQLP